MGWFHRDKFAIASEGGPSFLGKVLGDAAGGESGVGERIRHEGGIMLGIALRSIGRGERLFGSSRIGRGNQLGALLFKICG